MGWYTSYRKKIFGQEILLCASKDGTKTYYHPEYPDTCILNWVGVNEKNKSNNCRIYPNPGASTLYIQTVLKDAKLEMYDANSRLVIQQDINETTTVNTSALNTGMYFYRVMQNGVAKESGKWVKQQ